MSPLKGRCRHLETKNVDSRSGRSLPASRYGELRFFGKMRRRRKECLKCGCRWTTYEVHEDHLQVAAKAIETLTTIDKLLSGEIIKPGNGRKPKNSVDVSEH